MSNNTQRIISIIAKIVALILSLSIICGLISAAINLSDSVAESIFDFHKTDSSISNTAESYLNIEIKTSDLVIKSGDKFNYETNNKNITVNADNNKINVKETKVSSYSKKNKIVLTLPKDFIYEFICINSGKSNITADVIRAKDVLLNLGAGDVDIDNLIASGCEINSGAGELKLAGTLNYAELNLGAGNVDFEGILSGECEINGGVGNINMKLLGNPEDYSFDIDHGVGSIKVDGKNIDNDYQINLGNNKIDINGVIGNITINFIKAVQ